MAIVSEDQANKLASATLGSAKWTQWVMAVVNMKMGEEHVGSG